MEPEDVKFADEDKMKERDILLLIAKYLDTINGKLEWIQSNVDAINKKLHEET